MSEIAEIRPPWADDVAYILKILVELQNQIRNRREETRDQVEVLKARIESLENSLQKLTVAFGLFALASVAYMRIRK